MGDWKDPFFNCEWELAFLYQKFCPSEYYEVNDVDEAACTQEEKSEFDVLGVVAGCGGDGGVGEGFFLFLLDCHVVGVEAGQDEGGEEHPEDVVYVDSSKECLLFMLSLVDFDLIVWLIRSSNLCS